jgi:hypothetical protein
VTPFALTDICTESSALSAGPCWLPENYAARVKLNLSNDSVIETIPLDGFERDARPKSTHRVLCKVEALVDRCHLGTPGT